MLNRNYFLFIFFSFFLQIDYRFLYKDTLDLDSNNYDFIYSKHNIYKICPFMMLNILLVAYFIQHTKLITDITNCDVTIATFAVLLSVIVNVFRNNFIGKRFVVDVLIFFLYFTHYKIFIIFTLWYTILRLFHCHNVDTTTRMNGHGKLFDVI